MNNELKQVVRNLPYDNSQHGETPRDKDIRELQDEALKTPGYSDDPHIESSNRPPKNEETENKKPGPVARADSNKVHGVIL